MIQSAKRRAEWPDDMFLQQLIRPGWLEHIPEQGLEHIAVQLPHVRIQHAQVDQPSDDDEEADAVAEVDAVPVLHGVVDGVREVHVVGEQ